MMRYAAFSFLMIALSGASLHAQFDAGWLQRSDYWNRGKAEFDIYEGTVVRYGQPRESEVIHILVREPFSPKAMVKTDDWEQPGAYPVLKMNQILRIPTGIYVYQQMHSNFWKVATGSLIKFSLTSSDSCGNTFKIGERTADSWTYRYFTYWEGMAEGRAEFTPPSIGCFYDELPMRVRTIDFSKERGEFGIQLAPTLINSKADEIAFRPAQVKFAVSGSAILVTVTHADGIDEFELARPFPHLLRRWKMADGGELRLSKSLMIDYWNYNKPGDKERALSDPALVQAPSPSGAEEKPGN
jgi:hypothetical protein